MAGLALLSTPLFLFAAVALTAGGRMSASPVMESLLMNRFSETTRGGDFGAARSVYFGLGSLGPAFVGTAAEFASYEGAFATLAAALLFSSVLVLRAR